jgi:hypothetical protein
MRRTKEQQEAVHSDYIRTLGFDPHELGGNPDIAALVPAPKVDLEVRWSRWVSGNGFVAKCNVCRARVAFEEVSRARLKTLTFNHCGRADRLPWIFRFVYRWS